MGSLSEGSGAPGGWLFFASSLLVQHPILGSKSCWPPRLWWLDLGEYEARVNLYFYPGVTAFGRADALDYQAYVTLGFGLDELGPSLTDPSALCSQS